MRIGMALAWIGAACSKPSLSMAFSTSADKPRSENGFAVMNSSSYSLKELRVSFDAVVQCILFFVRQPCRESGMAASPAREPLASQQWRSETVCRRPRRGRKGDGCSRLRTDSDTFRHEEAGAEQADADGRRAGVRIEFGGFRR